MKNRVVPFGYQIADGKLGIHPDESEVVKWIFTVYAKGQSYRAIAEKLCHGRVRYHADTPQWNKHMVKRILENTCYTGTNGYPQLVDEAALRKAAGIREGRERGYSIPPAHLAAVKGRVFCEHCGSLIVRTPRRRPAPWICQNESCCITATNDRDLFAGLVALMNAITENPGVIDIPPVDTAIQSDSLMRMEGEIARLTGFRVCDEALVTNLILDSASAKYTLCDDGAAKLAGEHLGRLYLGIASLSGFDDQLFLQTFKMVIVGKENVLSAKMRNGQRIVSRAGVVCWP